MAICYDFGMKPVEILTAGTIEEAVARVLAEADADIAARKPVCKASGRCCKFEEYGHRLYVTAGEMLHFARVQGDANNLAEAPVAGAVVSLPQFFASESPRGCPYQVEGLCTAREARPLGCRLYFCDENAQSWQNEVYENYHAQLRALHERYNVPYRYLEWRAALKELA
jgi:Fe-S-cluster containining protein